MTEVGKIGEPASPSFLDWVAEAVLTWTPRIIVAAVAGYYSLGIAYETGLMAEIDKIAIQILKNWVGYAGLGALMPTFQWYSAWAVRFIAGAVAGLLYDLLERLVCCLINSIWGTKDTNPTNEGVPV